MASVFPKRVRVMWNEDDAHVPYAANLAELLGVPLLVAIPTPSQVLLNASTLLQESASQLCAQMHMRVNTAVRKYVEDPFAMKIMTSIEPVAVAPDDLYVSCDTEAFRDTPVLSPAGERRVFRGEASGPIFVPIGDGPSGIVGVACAAQLAKRLSAKIILWHTTWRNDALMSDDLIDHLSVNAKSRLMEARRIAEAHDIDVTTVIESVPKLVEGLIGAALAHGASLIVMAHGGHKEFGTYTERVRARNCPIPMLVIPKEAA